MSQYQNDPIIQLPNLYINGLIVSNDATTPNTRLNIAAGIARDSQNVMDLCVGVSNPNVQNTTVSSPLIIDSSVSGVGGLDTGSIAASTVYAVYIIGDSRYYQPTAGMISLASNLVPTMPFKYDSWRLIGYAVTDGSSNFLPMYISGTGNARMFTFDAPQAIVTAGASTSYAAASLGAFVPAINNTSVCLYSRFVAAAAADVLNIKGVLQTGDAVTVIAPVAGATANTTSMNTALAQVSSGAPRISYKVSAGTVGISLVNYTFYV